MRLRAAAVAERRALRIYHRMAPGTAQEPLLPFWVRLTLALVAGGAAWALLARLAGSWWCLLPTWGPVR